MATALKTTEEDNSNDFWSNGGRDEEGYYTTPELGFEAQELDPDNDLKMYGTKQMPFKDWVKVIKKGERKWNPDNDIDKRYLKQLEQLKSQGRGSGLPDIQEVLAGVVGATAGFGNKAAYQAGSSLYDPYVSGGTGGKLWSGVKDTFSGTPQQNVNALTGKAYDRLGSLNKGEVFYPELANRDIAAQTGNLDAYMKLKDKAGWVDKDLRKYNQSDIDAIGEGGLQNIHADGITMDSTQPTYLEDVGGKLWGTDAAKANWAGAGAAGLFSFGAAIIQGEDPVKAAKKAVGTGLGTALGNAIAGPIGGAIGGFLGGLFG